MTEQTLTAALGRYPETEALHAGQVAGPLALDLVAMPQITRAFAPMVRTGAYHVSEMAIATFLMAKARGRPLVLLPVVLSARFQERALLTAAEGPVRGPADLAGATIAVRAWSQTTGMWLRGILADLHGGRHADQSWITFEGAHVEGFQDPLWVRRAEPGQELAALVASGAADAGIFGLELPAGGLLRPVFPDLDAAGAAFQAQYGFVPVNHLVVMRADVAHQAPAMVAMLRAAGARVESRAALAPALLLAIRYCREQGLIEGDLTLDQLWDGLPPEVA